MIAELVVISGKGGSGKTSLTASFAALAKNAVFADCDVDAADLHLILKPDILEQHEFRSGVEAVLDEALCTRCGQCFQLCRFSAIRVISEGPSRPRYVINEIGCEGCGVCARFCPVNAISMQERLCGDWMISRTRFGPMVHAALGIAAENSGKLVSLVRREARNLAEAQGFHQIIVDGPPGIGCPVIASVTGTSLALIVAEPTVSGEHDMLRALALTTHFAVPAAVCINKWDLNPELTEQIEAKARQAGAAVVGRIQYDPVVTKAQLEASPVVEYDTPSALEITRVWRTIEGMMHGTPETN